MRITIELPEHIAVGLESSPVICLAQRSKA